MRQSTTSATRIRIIARLLFLPLALGAAMALPVAAIGDGQQEGQHEHQAMSQHEHHEMSQQEGAPGQGAMMSDCRAMMAEQEKMMEKRQAMDEKLEELLAAAQSATGKAKIEALEGVVAELVAQRRAMGPMMMKHQSVMMGHMAQHMAEGGMKPCPMMEGMMQGQMMQGMMPEGEGAEGGHSEHHQN